MLAELSNTRQFKNEGYRRWFSDKYFDLIVWYDVTKTIIVGFQLCYDKFGQEHAFTWHKDRGFSHNRIDDGEEIPGHSKMSPILVNDGMFSKEVISDKFKMASRRMDSKIADFVYEKIKEYPDNK